MFCYPVELEYFLVYGNFNLANLAITFLFVIWMVDVTFQGFLLLSLDSRLIIYYLVLVVKSFENFRISKLFLDILEITKFLTTIQCGIGTILSIDY